MKSTISRRRPGISVEKRRFIQGVHRPGRLALLLVTVAILALVPLFASGCDCDYQSGPGDIPPQAIIESISPMASCGGETVTFVGHGHHSYYGDSVNYAYSWDSDLDGHLSDLATFSTSSLSEGTHTITFKVCYGRCSTAQRTIRVAANCATTPPIIEYFNASPQRVNPGQSSALSWSVFGARAIRIEPAIGDVFAVGSCPVAPQSDTTYTLTATNEFGSVTASVQVRIIVLPVIESFTAVPDRIEAGNTSTLSWTALNATRASLSAVGEPGTPAWTQTVSTSGSTNVSPTSTTSYTLTATNDFGTDTKTVQVTVLRRPAPEGFPDLVITDVRKVESPDGYRISYTIKNQGAVVAGQSTTKVYANGNYWDSDPVGALQPGMWVTRQFSGKLYNPAYNTLEVRADADNAVREGNEQNNSKQVVIPLDIGYDFVANAASARWASGPTATTTTTATPTTTSLSFGGSTNDDRGFVCYLNNARMEDGRTYPRVLVTHPKWVYNGYIQGLYPLVYTIRPGDHFVARIGIVEGRTAGRVNVNGIYSVGLTEVAMSERGVIVVYNGAMETISYKFPADTFGKMPLGVILKISTDGDSTQDWAAWVEAMIVR